MIDTPPFAPRNPDFETRVRSSFARQGLMALLGAELTRIESGVVEIVLPVRDELSQQHGYVHAGAASAILDSACGYAALTLMRAADEVVSAEFKVNLLAPSVGERIVARGQVVRPGRTLTVCTAEATAYGGAAGAEGTRVALMTATLVRVDSE